MPTWKRADLMEQSGAPDAQGRPFAYVTHGGSRPVSRVLYRSRDSHLLEVRLEDGQWHQADLTTQAGAPNAASHPFAYESSSDSGPVPRVVYREEDGNVLELRLEGGSWKRADLSQLAGAPGAQGTITAGMTEGGGRSVARVVYRGGEGHVHEVRLEDGSWKKADLTALAGAPNAGGDPFLYLTGNGSGETVRIVYLGSDAHIHELRLEAGESWKRADLSDLAGAPDAASGPVAYVPDAVPRVIYRGTDGHVHEIRLESGSWKKADLTDLAGAGDAQGQPSAYGSSDGSNSIPRIVHRDGDGHIAELRLQDGAWKQADLTDLAGAPPATGDPVGYLTLGAGGPTPRVLYRAGDNHIHELRLE